MSQFPEEPLDLSNEQGFGYFPGYPGSLLKEGRYKILRKLGYGPRSSVWFALDLQNEDLFFVVLKVLTVHATAKKSQELHILQKIKGLRNYDLPILRDNFVEKGHYGDHLCFALDVSGPDVDTFRQTSPTKSLDVYVVKKIIAQIVEPLITLEDGGIIHGAIKADNLLFWVPNRAVDLNPILDASPPSVVLQEVTVNGVKLPIVLSEPFSHHHKWDDDHTHVSNYAVHLSNFGHAQTVGKKASWDRSVDRSLRPPEVILGVGLGLKADIWMLGCTTYHLLTGTPLFPDNLDDSEHLARILAITKDSFTISMAKKFNRPEFFEDSGIFKHPIPDTSLEAELRASERISEDNIPAAVKFILDCLSLDPENRPSATASIGHAWVKSGFACSCGFEGH